MAETAESLTERGICPTCYNRAHGGVFPDISAVMLYEDDLLECFLEARPRSVGHTIILLKDHYEDMSLLPDDVCAAVFAFAKKAMNVLKEVLGVEKVYLCTMCDGKVNHFHVQLIPRHKGTPIGSRNFVKERTELAVDRKMVEKIRQLLRP